MKAATKISELRTSTPVQLQQELNDLLKAQFNLRMQIATQQLTNHSQIKKIRATLRVCARCLTRRRASHEVTTTTVKNKRTLSGRIVSDKMDKTVTVLVEHRVKHPIYGKVVTRSKKYHAHDASNQFKEGDTVLIEECRPLAKTKAWRVAKLVEKARTI